MKRRTQRERTQRTRAALTAAALELFSERGYHQVSAEAVAARAGVTSGALYHHFADKRGVFAAALESAEAGLAARVAAAAAAEVNAWKRLERGIAEYLDACAEPSSPRLLFLDAPSVLGADEWRRIEAAHHLRPLRAGLAAAMRSGSVERRPPEPLALLLLGALREASTRSGDDQREIREAAIWLAGRLRHD